MNFKYVQNILLLVYDGLPVRSDGLLIASHSILS
jgi:hypothetical protein